MCFHLVDGSLGNWDLRRGTETLIKPQSVHETKILALPLQGLKCQLLIVSLAKAALAGAKQNSILRNALLFEDPDILQVLGPRGAIQGDCLCASPWTATGGQARYQTRVLDSSTTLPLIFFLPAVASGKEACSAAALLAPFGAMAIYHRS